MHSSIASVQSQWENIQQQTVDELIHASETICRCALKPLTRTASPSCSTWLCKWLRIWDQTSLVQLSFRWLLNTFRARQTTLTGPFSPTVKWNILFERLSRRMRRVDMPVQKGNHLWGPENERQFTSMLKPEVAAMTEGFFVLFCFFFLFQNDDIHIYKKTNILCIHPSNYPVIILGWFTVAAASEAEFSILCSAMFPPFQFHLGLSQGSFKSNLGSPPSRCCLNNRQKEAPKGHSNQTPGPPRLNFLWHQGSSTPSYPSQPLCSKPLSFFPTTLPSWLQRFSKKKKKSLHFCQSSIKMTVPLTSILHLLGKKGTLELLCFGQTSKHHFLSEDLNITLEDNGFHPCSLTIIQDNLFHNPFMLLSHYPLF